MKLSLLMFLIFILSGPALSPAFSAGTSGEDGGAFASDDPTYLQAVAAIKAEEFTTAAKLLRDVIDTNPDNIDAMSYLGYAIARLGRYVEAKAHYDRALALQPGHRGANEYLGELYLRTGNVAGAGAQLSALKSLCGMDCEEYKDLAAAIAHYRKTGRLPDHSHGKNEQ